MPLIPNWWGDNRPVLLEVPKYLNNFFMKLTFRQFPSGSVPLTKPALSPKNLKTESDNDVLHAVSQRFTYFQNSPNTFKKIPSKTKKVRKPMTVRLRPRQILCSKCKLSCTDNPDNIENHEDLIKNQNSDPKNNEDKRLLRSHGPVPDFSIKPSDSLSKVKSMCRTLIPKLVKLESNEVTEALNKYSTFTDLEEWVDNKKDCKDDCDIQDNDEEKMVLRKKTSIGSMEDLWDETAFEETKKTPIIKITFGSQGEGTVVEIPSRQADGESVPDKLLRKRAKRRRQDGEKRKKHKKRHKVYENDLNVNHYSTNLNSQDKFEFSVTNETNCSESINNVNGEVNGIHSDDDLESNSLPELAMIPQTKTSDRNSFFVLKTGKILHTGDVVWGKVKGFPWWPAKVCIIIHTYK